MRRGRLSKEDKQQIVRMYKAGRTQRDLAMEFGVSQPTISYIVNDGQQRRPDGRVVERLLAGQLKVLLCLASGDGMRDEEAVRLMELANEALRD